MLFPPCARGTIGATRRYLPVVGRGEQIRLLAAEHDIDYETVLPAGFGGEYNWAEQAPHGTVPWGACSAQLYSPPNPAGSTVS